MIFFFMSTFCLRYYSCMFSGFAHYDFISPWTPCSTPKESSGFCMFGAFSCNNHGMGWFIRCCYQATLGTVCEAWVFQGEDEKMYPKLLTMIHCRRWCHVSLRKDWGPLMLGVANPIERLAWTNSLILRILVNNHIVSILTIFDYY